MKNFIFTLFTLLLVSPSFAEDDFAIQLVGTYKGEIWSNSLKPGTTTFSVDSNNVVTGVYSFQDGSNTEKGTLDHCERKSNWEKLQKNKLSCVWHDKYGSGTLDITFSSDFSSFSGLWGKVVQVQNILGMAQN